MKLAKRLSDGGNSLRFPELNSPTTLSDFALYDSAKFAHLHHQIGERTWATDVRPERGKEAVGMRLNADYLAKLSKATGSATPLESYADLVPYFGDALEPLPTIFRPFSHTMLSASGPSINATKMTDAGHPVGVISEMPQSKNLPDFIANMIENNITSIVSLASASEMPVPYWQNVSYSKDSVNVVFESATVETWGDMGQFVITSPKETGKPPHKINVYRINPDLKDKFDVMWRIASKIAEGSGTDVPQTLAHCKLGLARSMSYKVIELVVQKLRQPNPGAQPFDLVDIVSKLREERPGLFPYDDAFIDLCKYLQTKLLSSLS